MKIINQPIITAPITFSNSFYLYILNLLEYPLLKAYTDIKEFISKATLIMKKITLIILLALGQSLVAQNTYIPDDNFEAYLETHNALGVEVELGDPESMGNGTADDNYVLTSAIETVVSLNISNKSISDLTGIGGFKTLIKLICSENQLESLDVTQNPLLEHLDCSYDPLLGSLDVTQNPLLEYLGCTENGLTTLDVTQNPLLIDLFCDENQLTSIDVTQNVLLQELELYGNQMSSVDVSQNQDLVYLYVGENQLTSLDVSQNIALEEIAANNNQLSSIDVSTSLLLEYFYVNNNQLTTLDVSQNVVLRRLDADNNQLTYLNLKNGNNLSTLSRVEVANNANLSCIEIDDVTDANAGTGNYRNWDKDNTTAYSEDCGTYVPDNNFETYLETHDAGGNEVAVGSITSMGNGTPDDNYVFTSAIENVTILNLFNKSISDLTGIEEFTAIEELICEANMLTTLDVTKNVALTYLDVIENQLTSIDLTQNTLLEGLDCSYNPLGSLDVTQNLNLTILYSIDTQLASLDVTQNILLEELNCSESQLISLDLSQNSALKHAFVNDNQLTSLDISQNVALEEFKADNNQFTYLNLKNGNNLSTLSDVDVTGNPDLSCIEVDSATDANAGLGNYNSWNKDNTTAYSEDCGTYVPDDNFEAYLEGQGLGNGVTGDNFVLTSSIETVTDLVISSQGISDLTGIADFIALEELNCSNNSLTAIDVTHNIALTSLILFRNSITNIDLTQNTQLNNLEFGNNQLTSLNVTNNTLLKELDFSRNQLTSIDTSQNIKLDYLSCDDNQLTSLDVSQNPLLKYFYCDANDLTDLDVSQNTLLEYFSCSENNLTSLDVSQNIALEEFYCYDNNLTSLNLKNGNNNSMELDATDNPDLNCIRVDNAAAAILLSSWDKDPQTSYNDIGCGLLVSIKVFLQGAALNPKTNEELLMRDDLRVSGFIPTTSPYADGVTCDATVFNSVGNDAIVDWVWIELRDATDNTLVINSQSALLQRDGNVVDVDGVSKLSFNSPEAAYFIVIKQRNHLGIMTGSTIGLSNTITNVDFTDANNQITYGSNAQTTFGMQTDIVAMWTGNANGDNMVQYSGTNPDTPNILSTVLDDSLNILNFSTYELIGYYADDVDMDGNTQYSGTNRDTTFILQNVLAHPENVLNFSTYKIQEQLPQN